MQRKRKGSTEQPESERKQIGCKINSALWLEVKILALKQRRTAGELLEDALKQYLEEHGE